MALQAAVPDLRLIGDNESSIFDLECWFNVLWWVDLRQCFD
jgi:hypothetical protein